VGAGDSVTLTATTAAASSNAWISSAPTVASVSNTGVVNGLTTGTTTITYTNSNGCTDTEIITVIVGTTQPPVLTSPVTNTIGATTLNINYTLPETPLSGSVNLTFTPVGGGTPIVWTMNNATSAIFSHVVGSNPTSSSNVVSGAVLGFTTYDVTLSYQDAFSNPVSSVTNTNIQTLAPPSISFASSAYNGVINTPISIATINTGGSMETYSIAPTLPTGLSFNTTTGLISGTPTVILIPATIYTVTATNAAGTDTESFTLYIDSDLDGDGIGNGLDPDIDGDGSINSQDVNPYNPCIGFNAANAPAVWQSQDCDGDGILNGIDSCPAIVNTSITTHPSNQDISTCPNTVLSNLTVAAVGEQLTYQWYSNTSNSNSGGILLTGATNASYVPSGSLIGLHYYFVVVSGSCGIVNSSVSGAFLVQDIVLPTVITQPVTVQLNATGSASITAAQIDNGSTDNCGIATITVSPSTFTCANVGANTVTLTVTDVNGNVSTGTATVTVIDNTAPIAIAQNINAYLNASGAVTVTPAQVNIGSSDNCSIATMTLSATTFNCNDLGANPVTLTVVDPFNNVSTANAVITVVDSVQPILTVPADITVFTNSGCSAFGFPIGTASATDNCSVISAITNNAPASYPVGITNIVYSVTDGSGNTTTKIQKVTVIDNIIPVVTVHPVVKVVAIFAGAVITGMMLSITVTF